MAKHHKITVIVVLLFTFLFAACNVYKLLTQTEEDIKQFMCHHVKHDDHKDMLRRQKHHRTEAVRSHTIDEEDESFEDKVRDGLDKKIKESHYQHKLKAEHRCRHHITVGQIRGMKFLSKLGIVFSLVSIAATLIAFGSIRSVETPNARFFLIPYIFAHTLMIAFEIYACIRTQELVHKLPVLYIVMVVVSSIMLISFISLVKIYYNALSKAGRKGGSVPKAKEAFDYAIMPEEKDASEA